MLVGSYENKNRKKAKRVSNYTPYENEIKLDGIPCPVPHPKIKDIKKCKNLRINVYGYDEWEGEFSMLHISDNIHLEAINLLLTINEDLIVITSTENIFSACFQNLQTTTKKLLVIVIIASIDSRHKIFWKII